MDISLFFGEDVCLIENEVNKKFNEEKEKLFIEKNNLDDLFILVSQNNIFDLDNNKIFLIYDSNNIFFNKVNDKNKSFLKEIKKIDKKIVFVYNGKSISPEYEKEFDKNVFHIKKLNKISSRNYIKNKLINFGIVLDRNCEEFLFNNLPYECSIIDNEIEKIFNFGKIKNIDELIKITNIDINKNIYDLLIFFFEENVEGILKQFNLFDLYKLDYYEIFNIIVMQLFNLKLYIKHYNQYRNIDKMLIDFSLQKFQVFNQLNIIKNLSLTSIDKLLSNLLELDIEYKSGKRDLIISLKKIILSGGKNGL